MKVAINTKPLTTGHKNRGIGIYTQNLIDNLKIIDNKNEYQLFEDESEIKKADIIHYPFFDPFFLSLPSTHKFPTVVTVHDLTPLVFSDNYPRGIKGEIKWQIQKRSLGKADWIITDSLNSKKDIVRIIKYPPGKISVVYLSQSDKFKRIKENGWVEKTKNKFNLRNDFLLYVGDVNFNKNLPGLFDSFAMLKEKNIDLVLVGESFMNNKVFSFNSIPKTIVNNVKILGYVHLEDLVKIYNIAKALCLPSFYEGFGLTILEAFACSCPVICSKVSSLPEVGGNTAIYINPNNPKDMANAIEKLLALNKKDYVNLKRESEMESKKYSWSETAKNTLKVYEDVKASS